MASPQLENGYVRIANEIMEHIVKTALLGAEFQILLFVVKKTYGYNKKKDWISLTQFEKGTGLSRPTVVKSLNNLVIKNLLFKSPKFEYSFNKNWETWVVNTALLVKHNDTASKDRLTNIGKDGLTHKRHNTIIQKTRGKAPKKTMKNNNWKYNEKNSSDTFEDVVDLDTGTLAEEKTTPTGQIGMVLNLFKDINPSYKEWFRNKTQINSVRWLLENFEFDKLLSMINQIPALNKTPYAPIVTSPYELKMKLPKIKAFIDKETITNKKHGIADINKK